MIFGERGYLPVFVALLLVISPPTYLAVKVFQWVVINQSQINLSFAGIFQLNLETSGINTAMKFMNHVHAIFLNV